MTLDQRVQQQQKEIAEMRRIVAKLISVHNNFVGMSLFQRLRWLVTGK
jgi:predicted aspartyl protease